MVHFRVARSFPPATYVQVRFSRKPRSRLELHSFVKVPTKHMFQKTEEEKEKEVASSLGAVYIDLEKDKNFTRIFRRQVSDFKKKAARKNITGTIPGQLVSFGYDTSLTSDEAVEKRYDIEYSSFNKVAPLLAKKYAQDTKVGRTNIFYFLNKKFNSIRLTVLHALFFKRGDESTYMFVNALLSPVGFELVTGVPVAEIKKQRIFDVGTGSGELLRFLENQGVPKSSLHGSDISPASVACITKDGFTAHLGRIETFEDQAQKNDIVFLSYFIDYDTNQRTTFEKAIAMTATGGKIILEGKLPCQPVNLFLKDQKKNFITKGVSAAEDIALICNAFIEIGEEQKRNVTVARVVSGKRYVYSSIGFRKLASYFLVFDIA